MIDFDSLWNYNDPAATEAKFRALLPDVQREDPGRHAELLTQIARTQGLQRQFDTAHRTLDEAERLLDAAGARAKVRYLLERGRVFNSSGAPERARPLFLQAWDAAVEADEEALAIDAAHMMGIIEPPAEQLDWSLRALEMAERSQDPAASRWRGPLYNNIGWSYHDLGDFDTALGYFVRSVGYREQQEECHETLIARWTVARTLRSLGRIDEALTAQRALYDERERRGESAPYVYEELGELLLLTGRAEEARPYFARAHAILSQDPWLAEREPERLQRMAQLADGAPAG